MTSLMCVAIAIYLEARGEMQDGMLLVADVIMTRVEDPRWPDSPCAVVQEDDQFAFLPFTEVEQIIKQEHGPEWMMALETAQDVLDGDRPRIGATHFHEKQITPRWTKGMTQVAQWGNHKFWRE